MEKLEQEFDLDRSSFGKFSNVVSWVAASTALVIIHVFAPLQTLKQNKYTTVFVPFEAKRKRFKTKKQQNLKD